ncbi:MAG TPA: hypothetical protein VGO55_12285 [Allosphingosinicella sp.]|jgi:hypothetical protein|nr:hypothetical protein [Allosphingosinicella sp.]
MLTQDQKKAGALAVLAIIGGAAANVWLAPEHGMMKVLAWLITMAMVVLLCGCIGKAIAGCWDGVLVDGRNRVSLSRLQMLAWTLLVLSALITAVASNLGLPDNSQALAIVISDELLAAMGIAAVSLAASPAVLALKGSDPATGISLAAYHDDQDDASWLDIFRGDDPAEANRPDLSKIQQFLITLALVGGYGVLIGDMFRNLGGSFWSFPALDPKFVWLLGISHAGYLTYKAAPKPAAPGEGGTEAAPAAMQSPPAPPPPA